MKHKAAPDRYGHVQVGAEVCAWLAMSINILWLCSIMMGGWAPSPFGGTAPVSFSMMAHAVVGVVIAADLKSLCRSERLKGYRNFLVVNGAFVTLELILLTYEIVVIFARPYWRRGDEWYYGDFFLNLGGFFVMRGNLERIFYMLVEICLNIVIQLVVRSMYKGGTRPRPSAPPAYIA